MKHCASRWGLTLAAGVFALAGAVAARPASPPGPALGHMVFFTLAEKSPAHRDQLVAACQSYLTGHQGTLSFSTGTRVEDLTREVNDQDFDVALHLVFASRADHDRYQEHPRHLEFIERNKALWGKVRVFDSYLATTPTQR